MRKRIMKYGILTGLVLIITLFIFSNSFAGYDKSNDTSASVSDVILPNKDANSAITSLVIRKTAHLVEYAMLGIAVMLLAKEISKDYGKKLYGFAFFYVLAIAVADEHIQSFSDRNSATGDIILDFCGGMIGFSLAWLIVWTIQLLRNRKNGEG